jgi:hypothetical protein
MNDLDKFIEVLKTFGCTDDFSTPGTNKYEIKHNKDNICVTLFEGIGYSGFHGVFTFDNNGNAEVYGLWE